MLKVFISMGKQMPKDRSIVEDAEQVAKLLAKYGCTMVQTGAKLGLMGIAVEEFEKYSDEMFMITPEHFKTDLEKHNCKQHLVVEFESDRMKEAIKNFDLAVILPGGMGTFAELAYFNEVCKSGESDAKILVVNSKGYYNKLLKFFKHQMKLGFANRDAVRFDVVKNAQGVESVLQEMIADKQNQMYQETLELIKKNMERAKVDAEAKSTKSAKTAKRSTQAKSTTKKTSFKSASLTANEDGVKAIANAKKSGRPAKSTEASKTTAKAKTSKTSSGTKSSKNATKGSSTKAKSTK